MEGIADILASQLESVIAGVRVVLFFVAHIATGCGASSHRTLCGKEAQRGDVLVSGQAGHSNPHRQPEMLVLVELKALGDQAFADVVGQIQVFVALLDRIIYVVKFTESARPGKFSQLWIHLYQCYD